MNRDYTLVGICNGWHLPLHETDEETTVVTMVSRLQPNLQLCPECLAEFYKDTPTRKTPFTTATTEPTHSPDEPGNYEVAE